ncbi:MAG: site-2 protease family protein [Ktedonobacterales bacterium]
MRTSFSIGKIAGIEIDINWSWLIIFVLLTVSLAIGWFPFAVPHQSQAEYWLASVLTVLLFFASVLAHELAHSLVARARGLPVSHITLFIFGGVSNIEREPDSPGVEFQMAFVGPLTSLVLGGLSLLVAVLIGHVSTLLGAVFGYLGLINILLGVFNLLPGFPLDGGRVLRSIIWRITGSLSTATRWAADVGQAIGYLMILAGIWLFFNGDVLDGLWLGFIALFLLQAGQAESAQVTLETKAAGVTVGQVMSPVPPSAPPQHSIQQTVDEYLLHTGQRVVPVIQDELLVGMVTIHDIRAVPRDQWQVVTLGQIMTPLAKLHSVSPNQPLIEALKALQQDRVEQLPVLDGGRIVGMIEMESVMKWMDLRHGLGLDRTAAGGITAGGTGTGVTAPPPAAPWSPTPS